MMGDAMDVGEAMPSEGMVDDFRGFARGHVVEEALSSWGLALLLQTSLGQLLRPSHTLPHALAMISYISFFKVRMELTSASSLTSPV
jgi:hypothetical protein